MNEVNVQTAYEIDIEGNEIHMRIINLLHKADAGPDDKPEVEEIVVHLKLRQAFALEQILLATIEKLAMQTAPEVPNDQFALVVPHKKGGGFDPSGSTSGGALVH